MQICFFEDVLHSRFHPLTLTRPVDDLRIGILTMAEKWKAALSASCTRILRMELVGVFEQPDLNADEPCLWINSRYLPSPEAVKRVRQLDTGSCLKAGSVVIAAKVDGQRSAEWLEANQPDFNSLFVLETDDFTSIAYLWDLFQLNGLQIKRDIQLLNPPSTVDGKHSKHAVLENKSQIFIGEGATVEAGCVLDAQKGPIYIGADATIMAGSVIKGPVAVCQGATVKAGARIYEDTTIGPVCKVGGEVSNTIFHSYSNKAHDGYIGNSVVGQWSNFGAGTTVSNLKTNYSTVRITDWKTKEEEDSGQQFLGVIMGDHSKTAINAVINSGTVCGVNCNILSRDFPPKFIDSFSWVRTNVIQPYNVEKALETMEIMMARRNVEISDAYKNMMKYIAQNSGDDK